MSKLIFEGRGNVPTKICPAIQDVKDLLDSTPLGKVYDLYRIAELIGKTRRHLQSLAHLAGEEYRFKDKCTYWYGNPKTIKEYKEERDGRKKS